MKDEILIRRFEKTDADKLCDMIHKSLHSKLLEKVYDDEMIDLWTSLYSKEYILGVSNIRHIYVAILDEHIVGSVAIHEDLNMGYISMVYTDPEIQGKGLGKQLLLHVENDEIALKTRKLYMYAALSANLFYQKLGYKYKDEIPEIEIDDGLDMIYLEKEL